MKQEEVAQRMNEREEIKSMGEDIILSEKRRGRRGSEEDEEKEEQMRMRKRRRGRGMKR